MLLRNMQASWKYGSLLPFHFSVAFQKLLKKQLGISETKIRWHFARELRRMAQRAYRKVAEGCYLMSVNSTLYY